MIKNKSPKSLTNRLFITAYNTVYTVQKNSTTNISMVVLFYFTQIPHLEYGSPKC